MENIREITGPLNTNDDDD